MDEFAYEIPTANIEAMGRWGKGVCCGRGSSSSPQRILGHSMNLSRPPDVVAPALVGARIRSTIGAGPVTVLITEVEAYAGEGGDAASHAHRGRTARNSVMFGRAGLLYIYRSHGLHLCLNFVTGIEGEASAVLLRAGEVVEGVEVARTRRPAARADRDLARGPGRLGAALGVTAADNGLDLLDRGSRVQLLARDAGLVPRLVTGPRVGISREVDRPWRWCWEGHAVSGPRP